MGHLAKSDSDSDKHALVQQTCQRLASAVSSVRYGIISIGLEVLSLTPAAFMPAVCGVPYSVA